MPWMTKIDSQWSEWKFLHKFEMGEKLNETCWLIFSLRVAKRSLKAFHWSWIWLYESTLSLLQRVNTFTLLSMRLMTRPIFVQGKSLVIKWHVARWIFVDIRAYLGTGAKQVVQLSVCLWKSVVRLGQTLQQSGTVLGEGFHLSNVVMDGNIQWRGQCIPETPVKVFKFSV